MCNYNYSVTVPYHSELCCCGLPYSPTPKISQFSSIFANTRPNSDRRARTSSRTIVDVLPTWRQRIPSAPTCPRLRPPSSGPSRPTSLPRPSPNQLRITTRPPSPTRPNPSHLLLRQLTQAPRPIPQLPPQPPTQTSLPPPPQPPLFTMPTSYRNLQSRSPSLAFSSACAAPSVSTRKICARLASTSSLAILPPRPLCRTVTNTSRGPPLLRPPSFPPLLTTTRHPISPSIRRPKPLPVSPNLPQNSQPRVHVPGVGRFPRERSSRNGNPRTSATTHVVVVASWVSRQIP